MILPRGLFAEILPLAAAAVLGPFVSPRDAFAATLVLVIASLLRLRRGVSRSWAAMSILALGVTGAGWLLEHAASPVRGIADNLICAAVFLAGTAGRVSLVQELAAQRAGAAFPPAPGLARFFRLYTLTWAAFFGLRAGAWGLARAIPALDGPALHACFSLSLLAMIAASFQGRAMFRWLNARGCLA